MKFWVLVWLWVLGCPSFCVCCPQALQICCDIYQKEIKNPSGSGCRKFNMTTLCSSLLVKPKICDTSRIHLPSLSSRSPARWLRSQMCWKSSVWRMFCGLVLVDLLPYALQLKPIEGYYYICLPFQLKYFQILWRVSLTECACINTS